MSGGQRGPAIRSSFDSGDGVVENSPLAFTPIAEPIISFGGQVAEETFGMANDKEPVQKALGASPSVAVTRGSTIR